MLSAVFVFGAVMHFNTLYQRVHDGRCQFLQVHTLSYCFKKYSQIHFFLLCLSQALLVVLNCGEQFFLLIVIALGHPTETVFGELPKNGVLIDMLNQLIKVGNSLLGFFNVLLHCSDIVILCRNIFCEFFRSHKTQSGKIAPAAVIFLIRYIRILIQNNNKSAH